MHDILQKAHRVFEIEIDSLEHVKKHLDESFVEAINLLMSAKGKVIITGMGKSGKIAEKIASTMCSTGTPAVFLHPSEAAHGDLGILSNTDVLITVGKSGESDEIIHILPIVRKIGLPIISLLGNLESTVAKLSDINININITQEACDLKLAPTSSTTAALVMGDALAMVLRDLKSFKSEDFALFHPSGQLGKRLLLNIDDVMKKDDLLPIINISDNVENLIYLISKFSLGVIAVCNDHQKLLGIITDGDLRRNLQAHRAQFFSLKLEDMMNKTPHTITKNKSAYEALIYMESKRTINHLPVVENETYVGMLSLHDLIKLGL